MEKSNKYLKLLLRIFISLLILGFLFRGMQNNMQEVKDNILSLHLPLFFLAVFLYFIISAIACYRLQILLTVHQINLSFFRILKNLYIGYLFNLFLLGSTGGDAIRSYYIAKETHRKTEVITLIFFDRLIGMTTMMCLALSSLLFNMGDPRLRGLAIAVMIILGSIVLFFLMLLNKDLLKKVGFIRFLSSRIFFRETLKKIYDTMHFFKDHKKKITRTFILSFLLQILAILSCYIVACSLTRIAHIPVKYFFLLMPIIFIGSALPVSIGGWGVFEMGFVLCFGLMGYARGDSFSIGLMCHVVLIILGLAGAVFYILPGTEHINMETLAGGIEGIEN